MWTILNRQHSRNGKFWARSAVRNASHRHGFVVSTLLAELVDRWRRLFRHNWVSQYHKAWCCPSLVCCEALSGRGFWKRRNGASVCSLVRIRILENSWLMSMHGEWVVCGVSVMLSVDKCKTIFMWNQIEIYSHTIWWSITWGLVMHTWLIFRHVGVVPLQARDSRWQEIFHHPL